MNKFKNKGLVRLYAFITACIIVITILATSVTAFAEGNDTLTDLKSLYSLDFNCFDYSSVGIDGSLNAQGINLYAYLYNNDKFTVTYNSVLEQPKYAFWNTALSNKGRFACLPEDSFILINEAYFTIWLNTSDSSISLAEFQGSSYSTPGFTSWVSQSLSNTASYNGVTYKQIRVSKSDYDQRFLVKSNIPVYYASNTNNSGTADFDNNLNTPPTVGNVSQEQYDDFEYLTGQSGIYFQCQNCNKGLVQFVAQYPNGLENPDNYCVKVTGSCNYNITTKSSLDVETRNVLLKYGSVSGTGIGTYDINGVLNDPWIIYYINLSDMGNKVKNYRIDGSGSTGSSGFGGGINDYMKTSSGASVYYISNYITNHTKSFWQFGIDNIADVSTSNIYGNSLAKINNFSSDSFDINNISYTFTMTLYKNVNENGLPDSNSEEVGSITRSYDMVSGTASEPTDTLTVDNQAVEDESAGGSGYYEHSTDFNTNYTDDGSGSGSGGGSGSITGGNNNIVINNNPTFNNDVSGGGSSGSGNTESDAGLLTFFNTFNPFKTIFNKLSGNNEVIADDTAETIGANRFITVLGTTFSYIPTEIWTTLAWFLGASLGILIVAVVLRIILDLL